MTPAEALRNLIKNNPRDQTGHVDALREALQVVEQVDRVRETPLEQHYGPIKGDPNNPGLPTPEAQEASRLLMLLSETQRGLVLCWFCNSCRRYVGPGDSCTCERDE